MAEIYAKPFASTRKRMGTPRPLAQKLAIIDRKNTIEHKTMKRNGTKKTRVENEKCVKVKFAK